jgi:hypothetical protein
MKWSGFAVSWLVLSLCVLYVLLKEVLFVTLGNYDELMQHADGSGLSPLLRGSGVQRTEEVKAVLSKFAAAALSLGPQASRDCGKGDNRKVVVRGVQYGQFSNNMISLVHGLGFTDALNRHYHESGEDVRYSFVVPNYMARMLHPFDLSVLRAQYCFYVRETPDADEEADQMPSFGLSTLFSMEKSLSEKWGKFAAYVWSRIDYAQSNIRKEAQVVHGLKGIRGLLQAEGEGATARFDPAFGAHDVRIESKMLFFWGQKAAISWRKQKFPFLFPDPVSSSSSSKAGVMITPNTPIRGVTITPSSSSSNSSKNAAELVQHERRHYTRTYLTVLGALYSHTATSVERGVMMVLDKFSPVIGAGSTNNKSSSSSSSGLSYSAAHRRNLDSECEATMHANSVWDRDFRGLVDLRDHGYKYKAGENPYPHPLCGMPAHFVHAVVKKDRERNRKGEEEGEAATKTGGRPIYISSDCKTDREDQHWLDYRDSNDPSTPPSTPSSISSPLNSDFFVVGRRLRGILGLGQLLTPSEQSCIDILLCALGSGVFVGNPRSTFTFQIIALRAILKLHSLPEVLHHDVYFTSVGEGEGEGGDDDAFSGTWVSPRSIHAVLNE